MRFVGAVIGIISVGLAWVLGYDVQFLQIGETAKEVAPVGGEMMGMVGEVVKVVLTMFLGVFGWMVKNFYSDWKIWKKEMSNSQADIVRRLAVVETKLEERTK